MNRYHVGEKATEDEPKKKYLHMKMMFIQQDYQWPATEKEKKSLWGYISKIYEALATVRTQMYVL